MKKYKVIFTEKAKKQLKKLDNHIKSLIIGWLEKNIENCVNPRVHGKALVENSFSVFKKLLQSEKIPVAVQRQAGCVD